MSSHPDSKIAASTGRCPSTWSRVPGCRWGRAWQKDRWQWRAVTSDRRTGNQMAAKVNFWNNTSMKPWCAMCDVRQGGKIKNMCDVLCRLPFPSGVSIYACCKSVWVICLCWRLQRTPTQIAHMLVFFNDSEQVQFSKQHDGTPSSFGRHRRANLQWSRIWSNPPIWFRNFEIDMFSGACKLHLRCFPTLHRALVCVQTCFFFKINNVQRLSSLLKAFFSTIAHVSALGMLRHWHGSLCKSDDDLCWHMFAHFTAC